MNVNQDWLDQRLKDDSYLPDDGFTARVVSSLPASTLFATKRLRPLILTPAFLAGFILFIAQVMILIHRPVKLSGLSIDGYHPAQMLSSPRLGAWFDAPYLRQAMELLSQPAFLGMALVAGVALGLASSPLLRRWI